MAKRFLIIDDDKLAVKSKQAKNENTEKAEKRADKAFTNFLLTMGVSDDKTNYWNYEEPQLDGYLAKFWFGAHKLSPEDSQDSEEIIDPQMKDRMYKATSLRTFRYGLNQILKQCGHLYDISDKSTASFTKLQQTFNDAIKELKSEGKADIDSYPEIEEDSK